MNELINIDTFYKAYKTSLNRRSYKKSSMYFRLNAITELEKLQNEIVNGTYDVSDYSTFYVSEPKVREIKACAFRDKIVQHVICDNIIKEIIKDVCILDNYSGQENKGTKLGVQRIQEHMKDFESRYGYKGYFLKCDISKYYYTINHKRAIDIMEYYCPENIHWLIEKYIKSTEGEFGIALGNQINTNVSCLYLDGLDKFITGELGIRYYCRYADDFILLHHDREYLKWCKYCIEEFLKTLCIKLNPKSQLIKYNAGVSFIGYHFYPNSVIVLDNSKRNEYKRKFNKMYNKVLRGEMDISFLERSYRSWKEHADIITNKLIFNYFEYRLEELRNAIKC